MIREEIYHITRREMTRLIVVGKLIERTVTVKDATEVLGLSTRQVLRLKKGVIEKGSEAIVHGNRGKRPANAADENIGSAFFELIFCFLLIGCPYPII